MTYAFTPVAPVTVPVSGSDSLFPVHRVYCVGRNYADHALEVGHDIHAEPPVIFCKPAASLLAVPAGTVGEFFYPRETSLVDYELELVVALDKGGANLDEAEANGLIFGYAAGLDLTRRDVHRQMMEKGKPWDVSKGFAASAPIGPIQPVTETGFLERGRLWLDLNGERTQDSDISHMIWSVPKIIAQLSRFFDLMPGDLIYTGTPKGVSPIVRGDVLRGAIEHVGEVAIRVA
jgi:fumarylpyruvate hydrolase